MRERDFDPRTSRDHKAGGRRGGKRPFGRSKDRRHGAPDSERPPRWRDAKKKWRPALRDRDGPVILYGWHSVKAALQNPARKFLRLLATENVVRRLGEDGIALPLEPFGLSALMSAPRSSSREATLAWPANTA